MPQTNSGDRSKEAQRPEHAIWSAPQPDGSEEAVLVTYDDRRENHDESADRSGVTTEKGLIDRLVEDVKKFAADEVGKVAAAAGHLIEEISEVSGGVADYIAEIRREFCHASEADDDARQDGDR